MVEVSPGTPNVGGGIVEVAGDVTKGLAPAHTGWILAVVLIVGILTAEDFFDSSHSATMIEALLSKQAELYSAHINVIEGNRSEELRRSQETIRLLADALSRDSERAGMAALSAIENKSESIANQ